MSRHVLGASLLMLLTASPAPGTESPQKLLGDVFALLARGDAAAALPKVEEALELSEKTGDRHSRALGLYFRGIFTAGQRGIDTTEEDWKESLDFFDETGDHFGAWLVRISQVAIYRQAEKPDEALEALQKTLEWLGETERSGSAGSFDTLKVLMISQALLPPEMLGMIDQLDAFMPLLQPILFRMLRATTLLITSQVLQDREEDEEALQYLEEAAKLSEHLGALEVQVLQQIARVKRTLGREEEAAADEAGAQEMSKLQAVSPVNPQLLQEVLDSLITDRMATGNQREETLGNLEGRLAQARKNDDVRAEAVLLGLLGSEYQRRKRQEESSFYYERSLETAWFLRVRSGESEGASGAELFAAIEAGVEADEILGASLHASPQDVYDALLLLAARDGQTEVAFDYAERVRAAASEAGERMPVFAEPLGLEELRAETLDNETSLLAYYVTGPRVLVWVVDRDRTEQAILDLPDADLFDRARALQLAGSADLDLETASALHRALIAPLTRWIRHGRLVVVANGVLRDLPFESFRDPETGRFLSDGHTVTRISSVGGWRSSLASAP